jgi:hypothetical protein
MSMMTNRTARLDDDGSLKPDDFEPDLASEEVADLEALQRGSWMEKIRFAWRSEDDLILKRIESAGEEMFAELFGDAITEVERFYASLRVPRTRNGMAVLDAEQRQVWETDDRGRPIEDWNQLTGQDIEEVLMNLQRIKMWIAPEVTKLKNQAVYSKMIPDDIKDDNWGKVVQGTQGDRAARANRASRTDRYHAFFRYCLWSTAETFEKELVQFMRRLEKVRDWRTWGDRA